MLRRAGIAHARALVAALETDADTVYVTLSARALRPDLVIVARARTPESKDKMVLAGATRAVNPQRIGGRRMAAFALQPDVAEFLDVVMHDENLDFRIQQVTVAPGLVARPAAARPSSTCTHRTGALLLAVRRGPDRPFEPNPADDAPVPGRRVGADRARHARGARGARRDGARRAGLRLSGRGAGPSGPAACGAGAHEQRWPCGTPRSTWSTCWPQPV